MSIRFLLTNAKRTVLWLRREYLVRKDPIAYARSVGVKIGEGSRLYGSEAATWGSEPYLITLGRGCHVANGARFITHEGGVVLFGETNPEMDVVEPIVVGDHSMIGMRAIILPGIRIGSNCIIGCNSVVTRDVPDNSVVFGVPARVVMSIDEYKRRLAPRAIATRLLKGKEKERRIRELLAEQAAAQGV